MGFNSGFKGIKRDGNTPRKQTILVRVPVSACNFFFLDMFYTHTQLSYAVTLLLFN